MTLIPFHGTIGPDSTAAWPRLHQPKVNRAYRTVRQPKRAVVRETKETENAKKTRLVVVK